MPMNATRLSNHIANRFLNDETLLWELMEMKFADLFDRHRDDRDGLFNGIKAATLTEPDKGDRYSQMVATYQVLSHRNNRNYYITDSVTENLQLLKVDRNAEGRYDYTIFKGLPAQKCTFILPDNRLVRVLVTETEGEWGQIVFEYIKFTFDKSDARKNNGHMNSCMFYVNRVTGEQCSHFSHPDVKEIEDYLYKLMCFVFLSDTEEVILPPGHRMGTRKSGKIFNEVKHPLIVVTSKWNITSVRTEGFAVSGHFRLQPYGEGRNQKKVIWIDPFEKEGYVRTAKKDIV